MENSTPKRIVCLGAGFVGVPIARRLAKRSDVRVTLIDSKDYFLFTPRLIDALADPTHDVSRFTANLPKIAERDGFAFAHARAVGVDRTARTVSVEYAGGKSEEIPYDILVVGVGARINFYGVPGADTCSLPLKTAEDVAHIHDCVRDLVKRASKARSDAERKRLLSFVVVGGGATGVESICALKQAFKRITADTKTAGLDRYASFTLVQAAPQILTGFPIALVRGAMRELASQEIDVRLGTQVEHVDPEGLKTVEGERISASLIVWAAGVMPNPLPMTPEPARDAAGCVIVDAELRVDDHIFAAGDVVAFADRNLRVPKNAQTSLRMADIIAKNIERGLVGREPKPFRYVSAGNLLLLGNTGIIDLNIATINTRLTGVLRDFFYGYRQRQIL